VDRVELATERLDLLLGEPREGVLGLVLEPSLGSLRGFGRRDGARRRGGRTLNLVESRCGGRAVGGGHFDSFGRC
jgi:hypothetical protein